MQANVGLCGRHLCRHICSRVCYCPLGQELSSHRLHLQQLRRQLRRQVLRAMVDRIEANIRMNAGSFQAFQLQLTWEARRRQHEQLERIPQT